MNYGFIIDNRKCIGCHACTVACKAEHDVPLGVNRTWVKYIEKGSFPNTRRHFSVMRCNHCDDAPCVEICPVTALFRRDDGIVDFDKERCIGCKACTQACPYDALYIDPETHTAAKCNYCAHRVDLGLEPACVNVCPEHAIVSGDIDDPASEISRLLAREQVTVRKPEKATQPKLFYIEADQASIQPAMAPQSTDYMWSSQTTGVGHYSRYVGKRMAQADLPQMLVTLETSPTEARRDTAAEVQTTVQEDSRTTFGKSLEMLQENVRRAYDAPGKGVMWGWEVAAYLWTKSISTGAFIVPFAASLGLGTSLPQSWQWIAVSLALLFLALTGVFLIKDLDRPDRFLSVLLRPQWKSWLVKGAYIISAYGLMLTLWAAAKLLNFNAATGWIVGVGIVSGILTAVYTAFLFGQARGRDFWQSPTLSFHFLAHSIMAGAAMMLIVSAVVPLEGPWISLLGWTLSAGILFHLSILLIEFMTPHPTEDAQRTARMIVNGHFKLWFWVGVVAAGNLVPLGLLWAGGSFPLAFAGSLTLAGIYLVEYIWVRAPQLIPLS